MILLLLPFEYSQGTIHCDDNAVATPGSHYVALTAWTVMKKVIVFKNKQEYFIEICFMLQ